jgi:signal transduction histidine kinase
MPDSPAADHTEGYLPLAEDDPAAEHQAEHWRVLIVDDDEDVHRATQLALHDVVIEGRPLSFLHAYTAAEALAILSADPTISTLLLDVVMETPDAGLQLVQRLRQDLGRSELRIILRTGQPGYAPEIETVRDFEINDYCTKAEMTSIRLFTSLTTAIRSYRLIVDLQRERDELQRLNASLEELRAAEKAQAEKLLSAEQALRLAHETTEQCVLQRTQELSQIVGELESFNRMVSHDLRGPLSGIAGISGLIQTELDRGDIERVRRWLSMMESHTLRLTRLVDDLLNLARSTKGELVRAPQPIGRVLADALDLLALSAPPGQLSAVSAEGLPELPVDAGLMRQVFVNLIGNALKFTRAVDAPCIEVRAEQQAGQWVFSVADNGTGFDAQRVAELFKPFGRLHGPHYEGSGIGLTIVRRIVERHGGRVWAENRPEGGARFCFTLPGEV